MIHAGKNRTGLRASISTNEGLKMYDLCGIVRIGLTKK